MSYDRIEWDNGTIFNSGTSQQPTYDNTKLNLKADKSYVDDRLIEKANKLDLEKVIDDLELKADKSVLNVKTDKSYVDSEIEKVVFGQVPNDSIGDEKLSATGVKSVVESHTSQLADSMSISKTNIQNFFDNSTVNLIMAGIDSLTNGAGNTKYLDYFAPRIRGEFGDGGPGYCPFDYGFAVDEGSSYGVSGMTAISTSTPGVYPAIYSLDNKGTYCDNGSNYTVDYQIRRRWTHGKLFYLIQPGGGTFKVGYASTVGTSGVTIDTNGTLGLGVYQMPDNNSGFNGQLAIRNITGKVALFGMYCYNDTGVIVSRIGKGGDKLAWHNSIDATFRNAWIQALQPKLLLFNGGTNDRSDLTADQYNTMVNSYLSPFVSNNCYIVLIRPQCIQSDTTWELFEPILRTYSQTNHFDFVSNKQLLGSTYDIANASGYMYDTVHPSVLGNKKIANNLLKFFGIPLLGVNTTNMDFPAAQSTKQYVIPLSTQNITITAGSTGNVYKLGLINGSPNGLLELYITGTVQGTSMVRKKLIGSVIANGTVLNQVTTYDVSPRLLSDIVDAHWGSITQCDFTVTFSTSNNQMLITLAPNSLESGVTSKNMIFTVEGKITLCYNANAGQAVYENSLA